MKKGHDGVTRYRTLTQTYNADGVLVRKSVVITNELGRWRIFPEAAIALLDTRIASENPFAWNRELMDMYAFSFVDDRENLSSVNTNDSRVISMVLKRSIPARSNDISLQNLPYRMDVKVRMRDHAILAINLYDKTANLARKQEYDEVDFRGIEDSEFKLDPHLSLVFTNSEAGYRTALLYCEQREKVKSFARNRAFTKQEP